MSWFRALLLRTLSRMRSNLNVRHWCAKQSGMRGSGCDVVQDVTWYSITVRNLYVSCMAPKQLCMRDCTSMPAALSGAYLSSLQNIFALLHTTHQDCAKVTTPEGRPMLLASKPLYMSRKKDRFTILPITGRRCGGWLIFPTKVLLYSYSSRLS